MIAFMLIVCPHVLGTTRVTHGWVDDDQLESVCEFMANTVTPSFEVPERLYVYLLKTTLLTNKDRAAALQAYTTLSQLRVCGFSSEIARLV